MLFPKALFIGTLPKIVKNSIFIKFLAKFSRFFKISLQFVFLIQTCEKLTHGFLTFLGKYAKIMHFAIFLNIFWKSSKILPRQGGSAPDPLRGRPPKVFPPNRNPGGAADLELDSLVSTMFRLK